MTDNVKNFVYIGINALHIQWGVSAGTEAYFSNIVEQWYKKCHPGVKFVLLCNTAPPWWKGERNNFNIIYYPRARNIIARILLEQIILPLTLYRQFDVIFNPGYIGSVFSSQRQVITIHDMLAWKFPKEIGWLRSLYWRIFIPISARKSSRLIAVSRSTASDITRFCKIDKHKISIITEAGSQLTSIQTQFDILEKLSLENKSYFLCVGFFKNIKNPWKILEAYKLYRRKITVGNPKYLVLVGGVVNKTGKAILRVAQEIPGVVVAGRINDMQLSALYQNSAGLIFTSLYEGFGIPILEAQSFNCPVITSTNSSMPEVAGMGAIIVDPRNITEISQAMFSLEDAEVAHRLIENGRKNLERFSWRLSSSKTLEVLRYVSGRESV